MDYLNARLASAEGAPFPLHLFTQQPHPGPADARAGGEAMLGLETQRKSGLDTMQDMGISLP